MTKRERKRLIEETTARLNKNNYDATVENSEHSYEILRIHTAEFSLIMYPHKCPSATGHTPRVRWMKGDRAKAYKCMADCLFSRKSCDPWQRGE